MYASRFSKRKAKSGKRPRKAIRRKPVTSRQAVTRIVKSVISRQAENKIWADYGVNQTITCAQSTTPTFKNLVPTIPPGSRISNRVGNEVRVKSGYIRGHVNLLPYNLTTNNKPLPCYVKMWVCSGKLLNTILLGSTNISTTFFEVGGSSAGFQGNMLDMELSPNKDMWTVHYTKTVKLGAGYVVSTGSPVSGGSYFDNSPMSVPFQFNFGKKLGLLKYEEDITSATNRNMFLVFQVVPCDGDGAPTQVMAEFHYTARVEYEDI